MPILALSDVQSSDKWCLQTPLVELNKSIPSFPSFVAGIVPTFFVSTRTWKRRRRWEEWRRPEKKESTLAITQVVSIDVAELAIGFNLFE
ncbi:hypothetical protein L484_028095 [Morus notabilis]|uniref:Uncharacterized protein n=1 Tax=Morus notabilis TaxID=981085 RepID=W9SG21_9ROSA|nr:hypothetical protein L484_028095 [Morus notabilis]